MSICAAIFYAKLVALTVDSICSTSYIVIYLILHISIYITLIGQNLLHNANGTILTKGVKKNRKNIYIVL